ncbi:MAG: formate dehydrogenase accessory sulfurtransferase FdhD [Nitrososphaerales archaeon]
MLVDYKILRFDGLKGGLETKEDVVAFEDIINLHINGKFYTAFHCIPYRLRELVIGRLLTDGIIESFEDIPEIDFSGKNVYVKISEEKAIKALEKPALIDAICSGSIPLSILKKFQRSNHYLKFDVEAIFKAVEVLNNKPFIYRASGGTHSAALLDEKGELIAFAEDIGRHNAIDKIVGESVSKGVKFDRLILASSGRLTSEMVIKAVWIMVPIMVSISAPTSMGIKIAETFGLTLIGFARGRKFNIYTFPDRIKK